MNANVIIKKASDGTTRLNAQIGVGSKRNYMLMEYDYLTLKFSTDTPTFLRLGDYVEIENVGRYELTSPTRGELNKNTGGYDYEIRLDAQYWKFKNKLCKFLPQVGSNETSWTYTDTLANHAQQILFNIRALAYKRDDATGQETLMPNRENFLYNGKFDWRIEWDDSVDAIKAVTIQYNSMSIINAIAEIAEAYECEWWFEQNVLHFGKCEYGATPVKLEMDIELMGISRSDSRETYATRIYAYGSDRNIASNYRKTLVFDAEVSEGKLHDPARELEVRYFRAADIGDRKGKADTQCVLDFAPVSAMESIFEYKTNAESDTGSQSGAFHLFKPDGHTGDEYDFDMTGERKSMKSGMFEWSWLPMEKPYLVLSTFRLTVTPTALNKVTEAITPKYLTAFFRLAVDYYDKDGQTKRTAYHTIMAKGAWQGVNKPIEFKFEDQYLAIPTEKVKRVVIENGSQIDFAIWYDESGNNYGYVYDNSPTISVKIDASGQIGLFEGWPEFSAAGITIEVLDKSTGEVDHTITGATFNAAFDKTQRKLTLPSGASISNGDKYRLPQLNTALMPARYFTSIYTVFEKYQDVTTNGIVNNRLLLPEVDEDGNPIKGYIDTFEFESEEEAVEDVVIFDEVYPSRISKITDVKQSDEYTEEQSEQDGSKTQISYWEYIITDDLFSKDNPFDHDYLIDKDLQVTFQSGLLNGMTFNVELLEDNYHFQIKRDDTTKCPNEIIKPKTGDEFILHGFNIAMISDSKVDYISNAEKELLRKTREYTENLNTDASTYQCTVASDIAFKEEENNPDGLYLGVGRSVNLIHPGYFKNGRISRVLGYEIPLDFAYDNPVYFVGEKAKYSRIGALEDRLDDTTKYGGALGGGGTPGSTGGSPYVIQQTDCTPPTDRNVYSALRSRLEFALKTIAQTIKHVWAFLDGIRIGTFIAGQSGAQIDKTGNAEFDSIRARGYAEVSGNVTSGENVIADGNLRAGVSTITPKVVSPVFTPETTGSGMSFYVDPATGKAIGWLDELNIRGNLNVVTLLIEELRATYGDIVCSKAAGEVEAVTISSAYQAILKLKDANRFMVGDFVRCWRSEEGEESLRTKSYWLKVYEVSGLTITVGEYSGAILDTDNLPEVGDNVVLMGAEDPASGRDGFTVISGNNGNVGISVYDDVNAPSQTVMDSALKARLGDLNGIQDNTFGALAGHGLFADVAYLKGRIALDTGELVSDAITASSDANTNLLRFTYDRIYTDATPAPGKLNTYQVQRYDVMTTVELVQGQAYTIRAKSNGAFTDTRAQWSLSDADSAENYVSIILFNPNVWKTDGSRKWDAGQEVSDSKTATASGTTFVWQQPTGRYALRILGFGGQKYLEDLMLVKGRRIAPAYTPAPADTEAMAGWASRNLLRNTGDGEGNAKWFSTPEPDESDGSMSQTLHMPNVVSSVKLERGKCYTFRCHTDAQLILPEVARWEALHGDSSIYPNKFASVALWRTVKNADGSVSWTDRRFISSNAESKGRFAPNEPATFFFDGENDNYWVAVESYGEQKAFNKLMLVRGRSISKEWSDAPEDSGDAVTGKIESVKTTLTADIQGFKTETNRQITEYQSDVNTQLTAMQTSIASNGDAIALKADKTTVDQLSGRVDTNAAAIAVMPDQITSQVSATYGGVNILPGTSDQWQEVNVGAYMGIAATYNVADLGITANESVVLSFDCKTTSGKKLRARLQWRNSDSDRESYTGHSSDFVQNGAGRLTCAATLPENITDYLYIDVVVDANLTATSLTSSSGELVRCLMLERGSTASATWAPNRGDIARVATEVSQTAEEINLTVKKAEVAAAGMTIDASGITLTGGKTSVKAPDGTDIAMFTVSDGSPTLNTSLVNADELVGRRFIAVDADGAMVSSFNEAGDGCIRQYYPATAEDKVYDDDGNFVRWNLHVQQESGSKVIKDSDGNDILTSMRYYAKDGILLWWIGASGLSANSLPYTFEPLVLAKTNNPNTAETLAGTTFYLFRSSSTDACTAHGVSQGIHTYASHDMTVYTSSGYKTLSTKATDGVYYSPECYIIPDVVLPSSESNVRPEAHGTRRYRKSYTIQDGKLTDTGMVSIG